MMGWWYDLFFFSEIEKKRVYNSITTFEKLHSDDWNTTNAWVTKNLTCEIFAFILSLLNYDKFSNF